MEEIKVIVKEPVVKQEKLEKRSRSSSSGEERRKKFSRSRSSSFSEERRTKFSRSSSGSSRSREHYYGRSYYGSRYSCHRDGSRYRYPKISRVLGVFGLSRHTVVKDLLENFERFGPIRKAQIIYDVRTGNSRGFGFIYFEHREDATTARRISNGMSLLGRRIRVDYSLTKRPHTPTPGRYMGEYRRNYSHSYSRSHDYSPNYYRSRGYHRQSSSRSR